MELEIHTEFKLGLEKKYTDLHIYKLWLSKYIYKQSLKGFQKSNNKQSSNLAKQSLTKHWDFDKLSSCRIKSQFKEIQALNVW